MLCIIKPNILNRFLMNSILHLSLYQVLTFGTMGLSQTPFQVHHQVYSFILFLLEHRGCRDNGEKNTDCVFCNMWASLRWAAPKIISYFILDSLPSSFSRSEG